MAGNIRIIPFYTRAMIRATPDILYVFGDNVARRGFGGQAKEARGEPNAVGIPTKMSPEAFLYDTQHLIVKEPIVEAFVKLAQHLRSGKDIVWPKDGVGTGLARLPFTGPAIFAGIEACREHLFSMADDVIEVEFNI